MRLNSTSHLLAEAPAPRPHRRSPARIRCGHGQSRTEISSVKGTRQTVLGHADVAALPSAPLSEADAALRTWIEGHGGSILSSLRLTDAAPCGCRGIVTIEPLPLELAQTSPLILVPERLYMTTAAARELLQPLGAKRFSLSFWREELPGAVQLAVLLALERKRGDDSFWAPYIRSLPAVPPLRLAMSPLELRHALSALGPAAEAWEPAVTSARNSVHKRAEVAVQRYGKHLPVDVRVEDVVWAMGQVLSRSFGRDPDIGMAPYIDLCNHRHGAPPPGGYVDERDGMSYAYVESSSFGEPLALGAGEEVYVSYSTDGSNPRATFLSLGFVPPEMLPLVTQQR